MSPIYFKKKIKLICPVCGKTFQKRNYKQIYCGRDCFKLAYQKKGKVSIYPFFVCPKCGAKEALLFYPNKSYRQWKNFKCKVVDFLR